MTVKIKMEGFKELDQALGQLPRATARNVLKRTLLKAGKPILDSAQNRAPVDTGKLKNSLFMVAKIKNRVGAAEFRAAMQAGLGREAASAAMRDARREAGGAGTSAYAVVETGEGVAYAGPVEYGTNDTKPQPFMRPAWHANKMNAFEIIKAELKNEIDKAVARLAAKAAKLAGRR